MFWFRLKDMGRKFAVLALIVAVFVSSAWAEDVYSHVLSMNEPIVYGEASFRERILQRTEGKRDPVGLVMTGSWAPAASHLGVLYYLEENSIIPDFIIANSSSAVLAVLYSAGASPEDIAYFLEHLDTSAALTLTFPVEGGFIDSSSLEALFGEVLGRDTRLENLRIPVMIVTEDLVTGREVRFAEGNAAVLSVASMSYPALFPPVEYEGHLLTDSITAVAAPLELAYQYTDTVILSTAFRYDSKANLLDLANSDSFLIPAMQGASDEISSRDDIIWINPDTSMYASLDYGNSYDIGVLGYESAALWSDSIALIEGHPKSFPTEDRTVMKSALDKGLGNLCFGRIAPVSDSHILSLDFDYGPFSDNRSYLTAASNLAFRYTFRNSWFEGGGDVGFAFDTGPIKATGPYRLGAYPMVGGFAAFYPFSQMRIFFDLQAEFLLEEPYIPELYGKQGLDFIIINNDLYDISVSESIEYRTGFETNSSALIASAGINTGVRPLSWLSVNADAGYMLASQYLLPDSVGHYIQLGASVRFDIPPLDNQLYFTAGVKSRIGVGGVRGAVLFQTDGYLSPNIDKNEDYYFSQTDGIHATIISLYGGWIIPAEPSIGSFFTLEGCEIGAFCDMLLRGSSFSVSCGGELRTTISLLGIAKLPLRLRLGYDSWADSFVSSFSVGFAF